LTVKQLKASGNIPSARAFASLTFYEDCLYLLGGSYEQGHLFYKLDLQSETWTEMSETLEFLIESHSAVVYRDFLYVSFGHNSTHL
jgi:N-acetylneuraminic acid mutarotase